MPQHARNAQTPIFSGVDARSFFVRTLGFIVFDNFVFLHINRILD